MTAATGLPARSRQRLGRRWVLAGIGFSAVGLVVSAYLAWVGGGGSGAAVWAPGAASAGSAATQVPFCGPGSACEAVWTSPYGHMAGLSLPGWGAAGFAALVVGGLAWARAGEGTRRVGSGVVALSWAVAGFAAYLVVLQAAVLQALCPWCLVADASGLLAAAAYTLGARAEAPGGTSRPGTSPRQQADPGSRGRARLSRQGVTGGARPAGSLALPALVGLVLAAAMGVTHWVGAGAAPPARDGSRVSPGGTASRLPGRLEQLEAFMSAGPVGAPARVDVYADFQCPYCARAATEVLQPLLAEDVAQGRMRIVFHNFAFLGAESRWAAEAAVCAAVQGRFWPFHDRLFAEQRGENVGAFRPERLVAMAREEGLEVEAFQSCLEQRAARQLVEASYEEGRSRGVRATPTFFVNGRLVEGLVPVEEIRRLAYGSKP